MTVKLIGGPANGQEMEVLEGTRKIEIPEHPDHLKWLAENESIPKTHTLRRHSYSVPDGEYQGYEDSQVPFLLF